jgi:hypothetical protein
MTAKLERRQHVYVEFREMFYLPILKPSWVRKGAPA